ncbi:MAG: hypothetical protein VW907_03660 [Opitutae bacterium]
MNRAVDIINSLRAGMETILKNDNTRRVNSLRMFNFEKNRVSVRMEVIDQENISHPMGMIDVTEYSTGAGNQPSCNCLMTELASGKSEKLVLKLNNQDQKMIECAKVFNFFRKVLQLPEINHSEHPDGRASASLTGEPASIDKSTALFPPADGKIPDSPRGAQ